MQTRHAVGPKETEEFGTQELRENFLIENLFDPDKPHFVYTHYDRMLIGGIMPIREAVELPAYDGLKSNSFLERREMGIINVGGAGSVQVNDKKFDLAGYECLYIGKGAGQVSFRSQDAAAPAQYFIFSAPAHQAHPTRKMTQAEAAPVAMGSAATSNERTIYKYIHKDGLQSCQLVMGLTVLKSGSVWNTMPAHVHDRRMEAYFYFDLAPEHRVFHLMGQPNHTRHLVVGNHQAVISPPWSIHSGCGTTSYAFIWGMAGENMDFTDMDFSQIAELQ